MSKIPETDDPCYAYSYKGRALYVPDSPSFCFYGGQWCLTYHDGFENLKRVEVAHDVAFAAVAAAEWRKRCSKPKECQCACTCTYCVFAQGWQTVFNELTEKLKEKPIS